MITIWKKTWWQITTKSLRSFNLSKRIRGIASLFDYTVALYVLLYSLKYCEERAAFRNLLSTLVRKISPYNENNMLLYIPRTFCTCLWYILTFAVTWRQFTICQNHVLQGSLLCQNQFTLASIFCKFRIWLQWLVLASSDFCISSLQGRISLVQNLASAHH